MSEATLPETANRILPANYPRQITAMEEIFIEQ
jgi:hypothetical protein